MWSSSRPKTAALLLVLALLTCLAYPFGLTFATTHPVSGVGGGYVVSTTRASSSVSALHATTVAADSKSAAQPAEAFTTPECNTSEDSASFSSKLLFRYVSPLLNLAGKRRLEVSDVYSQPENKRMGSVVPKLSQKYAEEQRRAKGRRAAVLKKGGKEGEGDKDSTTLALALLNFQRRLFLTNAALRLTNTAVQAFPALLVARLLRLVEAKAPMSQSVGVAAALIAVLSAKMVIENQYFHNVIKYSTQVRGALTGLIFDKALRVANAGPGPVASENKDGGEASKQQQQQQQQMGAGAVLNLMQSDASTLESTALQLHTIWDGPLQISVYTFLLYRYLGPSVLWGISVLLLTIPVNIFTLRLLNQLSKYENRAKDARTKRTTEAISNMKLLKLQAWEQKFAQDIEKDRNEELKRHTTRGIVRALNQAISNAVPAVVLVVTLMAYSKSGKPIVASTIFTAISLFNQLRFPLLFYPMLIDSLANGKNALKRISRYLEMEEVTPYVQRLPGRGVGGGGLEMKNGNFLWSSKGKPALCDANLSVRPGEVVAVVGNVGMGKSALVKALLGELAPVPRMVLDQAPALGSTSSEGDMDAPTVITYGPTMYCSQEAWLSKGTLRDAVVFGRPYDEERYQAAIRDAGLEQDICETEVELAKNKGDKKTVSYGGLTHTTDVGEGGSSLSGGQRARVALARALYDTDAGVYLLDDPLAALDASVGATVFERLTTRLRNAGAATIFVTNDPSLPQRCDRVVVMGMDTSNPTSPCSKIIDIGTYEELVSRGHNLRSMIEHKIPEATADHEDDHQHQHQHDQPQQLHPRAAAEDGKIEVTVTPKLIRVDGQFQDLNSTYSASTCHADPDCQNRMGRDPDCPLDQVLPQTTDLDMDVDENGFKHGAALVSEEEGEDSDEEEKEETSQETATASLEKEKVPLVPTETKKSKVKSADDAMTTGAVPRSTYLAYFRSVKSPVIIAATLMSYLLVNGAQFFQQYVVAKWTELGKGDAAIAAALGSKYLQSLARAALVVSTFLWVRSFLLMKVGVRASRHIHKRMLKSVVEAPISFFDATPSGQLISRFGKELDVVDRSLPDGIGSVLFCFLQIFASCAALAGVVTPAMLVPIGLIGALYTKTMGRFRPAARDLKRCESKSRAPIYTHFREALRGAETIRSVPGGVAKWSSTHRTLTDTNLSVFYAVKAMDRWLSVRLETLGNGVVFTAAIASIILSSTGRMKAGSAGWGLTQSLAITGLLTWAVRVLTDLESQMMSVLRIQEIADLDLDEGAKKQKGGVTSKTPRELLEAGAALKGHGKDSALTLRQTPTQDSALVASGWPWEGRVQFNGVSMRYNKASPLVLKNVSINVPPGTTLGIVGRSGSGKSSLLLALFRLVELDGSGSIQIDGVDTRSVSLNTLRSSLSIIPQDPVLFAGSVMYNLDATGRSSREDAWTALETASPELAQQFKDGQGLDTVLSEGGKNLSVGQRQLICLARALLRRSKILVLDEATSSVDSTTDAQVQETIRREFVNKGVTVITVAHRLETVLGYDRIAVLGNGRLLEIGSPNELLRKKRGMFRRMVDIDMQKKKIGKPNARERAVARTA